MSKVQVFLTGSEWALVRDGERTYRVDLDGPPRDVSAVLHLVASALPRAPETLDDVYPYAKVRALALRVALAAEGVRLIAILMAPDLSPSTRRLAAEELDALLTKHSTWRARLPAEQVRALGAVLNADAAARRDGRAPPPVSLKGCDAVRALLLSLPVACSATPRFREVAEE